MKLLRVDVSPRVVASPHAAHSRATRVKSTIKRIRNNIRMRFSFSCLAILAIKLAQFA
jgi:hypothetical protein